MSGERHRYVAHSATAGDSRRRDLRVLRHHRTRSHGQCRYKVNHWVRSGLPDVRPVPHETFRGCLERNAPTGRNDGARYRRPAALARMRLGRPDGQARASWRGQCVFVLSRQSPRTRRDCGCKCSSACQSASWNGTRGGLRCFYWPTGRSGVRDGRSACQGPFPGPCGTVSSLRGCRLRMPDDPG